jgi:hypothetical protein
MTTTTNGSYFADRDGPTARVMSSAHGPLRRLLVQYPVEATVRPAYRRAYGELFGALPHHTELVVLVAPQVEETLWADLAAADRAAVVVRAPGDLRFSVWAQDPCVVVEDDDGAITFLEPAAVDRASDRCTVRLIAEALGARVQRTDIDFDGGDVVVTDDVVLLGRTSRALDEGLLGRPTLQVGPDGPLSGTRTRPVQVGGTDRTEILPGGGPSPHPLIHLDMFLTPAGRDAAGRYRLLVGSPSKADEFLGRPPVDPVLDQHLDGIADELAGHGFEVVRNPLPLTWGDGRRVVEGQECDVRMWYLASANNCLVQTDPFCGDCVWLPTYGHGAWRELAPIDTANKAIWRALEFRVHQLGSFHSFAQRYGALHCIAKDLGPRALRRDAATTVSPSVACPA